MYNEDCTVTLISQLTFKLGLSYTPLAQAGLDALQSWTTALPADVLKPHLSEILPCLDGYLKTSAESSKSLKRLLIMLYSGLL